MVAPEDLKQWFRVNPDRGFGRYNADGTIDLTVDGYFMIEGEYPQNAPKIRNLKGMLSWSCQGINPGDNMPETLSGPLTLQMHTMGEQIKTSSLPKAIGESRIALVGEEGLRDSIMVDDDTLNSYSDLYLQNVLLAGQLEHLPRHMKAPNLSFGSVEGIPEVLEAQYVGFELKSGAELKGIGKKIKRMSTPTLAIYTPGPFPILGLMKALNKDVIDRLMIGKDIDSANSKKGKQLANAFMTFVKNGTNLIDAQDALIDAGLSDYARL